IDIPVLVSVFNTRLKLLEACRQQPQSFAYTQAVSDLRAMLGRIPQDSFPVHKVWAEIEQAWTDAFWLYLTPQKIEFLRLKVGPLLRFAANVDVAAETFTNKGERLKLQILNGNPSPDLLGSIADDVSRLPEYVHEDTTKEASIKLCLSQDLARATPEQLTAVIHDLAGHMKNRRERPSAFLKIDLPDFIAAGGHVTIGDGGRQIYVEEYRKRVEGRILEIAEQHPTLVALREGRPVTDEQLVALERTLHADLSRDDIQLSHTLIRRVYGIKVDSFLAFLRFLLDLDVIPDYTAVVRRCFDRHITEHNYTGDQIRFLRSVQEVFLQKRTLAEVDLYEPPLTLFGRNAVDRFFTPEQIRDLMSLTDRLAA
ncbi:MAG: type I restriction-modification enzyme R subunit C-terminal domain-containing protein, partial [Candidatus Binatia bacterium]